MPIRELSIKYFTAFSGADLTFSPGLNVFVGENGTGKTHLLKLLYTAAYATAKRNGDTPGNGPRKGYLQTALADSLKSVFRPDDLGRLVRRNRPGRQRSEVRVVFAGEESALTYSFNSSSKSEVAVDELPVAWGDGIPVYLPTRELLTIYPGFVSLYETSYIP
jgi:predicted ATPase